MNITEDMIEAVRVDPVRGALDICDYVERFVSDSGEGWTEPEFDLLLETYSLLVELIDSGVLGIEIKYPTYAGFGIKECTSLMDFVRDTRARLQRADSHNQLFTLRARFKDALGRGFVYEFSQGDLDRVQGLLNELREEISKSTLLQNEHKQRLLRRLEKLQSELHKRVSDLDRFWGLIGDAGVALGKLGKDAKPIVDRVREIAKIVWQTQSRAEELPSGTDLPWLGNDEDDEE